MPYQKNSSKKDDAKNKKDEKKEESADTSTKLDVTPPAANKDNPKSGDNPNKRNAEKPTPKQSSKKNTDVTTKPILESIDPYSVTTSFTDSQGIIDTRKPGTPGVCKITLHLDVFAELSTLTSGIAQATAPLVYNRVELPDLSVMAEFFTHYAVAYQLYSTLMLNSTDGMLRKLKVLRLAPIQVPDFLPALVHCFGNYTTNEGLVRISTIENLIMLNLESCLEAYSRLPRVRQLHGYNTLSPIAVYDTINFREDFCDLVYSSCPEVFGPFKLIIAAAVQMPFEVDMRNGNVETLRLLFLAEDRIDIDEGTLLQIHAFLKLRDLPYDVMADDQYVADFTALDLIHGSRRPITQIADWLNIALPEYSRVCYRALQTVFITSEFVPSKSGTASQLVERNGDRGIDESQAQHTYSLSPISSTLGFILQPCLKVEYCPEYVMFSNRTRYQIMMRVAEKYISSHIQ